jgi:hypothetical protein
VRRVVVLTAAGLLAAAVARADPHLEMRAAQQELKLARKQLKAAGTSYSGHRLAAIEAIEAALREIRDALAGARGTDADDE